MNSHEFVNLIRSIVRDGAVEDTLKLLERPPGRRPPEGLVKLSHWYHALPLDQREWVKQAISEAVDAAVFGFLAVLDGVRQIEAPEERGELKLIYERDGNSDLLNDFNKEFLHDIFKQGKDS